MTTVPPVAVLARAIHDSNRIAMTRHGAYTDRCICNSIAEEVISHLGCRTERAAADGIRIEVFLD